jgi:hypothetical protein
MTDITNVVASQRILAHLHEGRLVQGAWHREQDGRELACVLGAISPRIRSASACPASVMPEWLAVLVVSLFDGQTEADAMAWAARFGAQMAQWHRLDDAAWSRVRSRFCDSCAADAADAAAYAAADAADAADAAAYAAADAAAAVVAADAADAADAAAAAAAAAREACAARLGTALCDLIDAELEAVK